MSDLSPKEAAPAGMWPAWLSWLVALPWMEEVLMILFTAVVYILAHYILKTRLLPQKKGGKQGKLCHEEEERSPRSARRPAAREQQEKSRVAGAAEAGSFGAWRGGQPKSHMELEGVTDSRFTGVIVCFKPEEGYGFIQCRDIYKRFGRDVFLHRFQVASFDVGDTVSFAVFLNKQGLPQAKDLKQALPRQPLDSSKEPQASPRSRCAKEVEPAPREQTWASAMGAAQALSGVWVGDRGATYEVHFYLNHTEGENVGTVLRCRPQSPPKSLHLRWDATQGRLQLSDHFALDLDALAEGSGTVTWWRGQSRFIWQRVPARHTEEWWGEDYWGQHELQGQEEGWDAYESEWPSQGEWAHSGWAEGDAASTTRRWGGQPPAQAAKRWLPKEEAM